MMATVALANTYITSHNYQYFFGMGVSKIQTLSKFDVLSYSLFAHLTHSSNHYATHCKSQIHPCKQTHQSSALFFCVSPPNVTGPPLFSPGSQGFLSLLKFPSLILHYSMTCTHPSLDYSDTGHPKCLNVYLHCYPIGLWIADKIKPAGSL